ncbi:MAG: hypothetical protein EOP56_16135 [Sphingobacteriales bacterium]|nr:MAG: hypothetical protein EOP56_16135 [Sphingobacteriales bacterium]
MEFLDKIRREIEQTEYFDGVDCIYTKLMILKTLNMIMGSSSKKTPAVFDMVKRLQQIYKEVPESRQFTADHFQLVKKRITSLLIQFRVEPYLQAVA